MIPLSLSEIAASCDARPTAGSLPEAVITAVSSDTRQLAPGALFVALKGERFNGHTFLAEAAARGAVAAVVSEEVPSSKLPTLRVADTLKALGDVARMVRERSGVRVLAITGSAGKTTTKEMAALVLSSRFGTLKSQANENNEIGVPSTLLRLNDEHEAAVIEMGMRGPGEIRYLTGIARPDVALITNIGVAHIGRLGTRQGIASAKAEILEGLRSGGVAVLNKDDDFYPFLAEQWARVLSFGLNPDAAVRGSDIEDQGLLGVSFRAWHAGRSVPVKVPHGGDHIVIDALGAIAAGLAFEVPLEAAAQALAEFSAPAGRGRVFTGVGGSLVIDDAYNASPDSMAVSLGMLQRTPGYPRRVAVLGDMLELGDHAPEGHREVGQMAARAGLSRLVCVGPQSRNIAEEAHCSGLGKDRIVWYPDSASAAADAASWSREADILLVKGSNGTRMNVIVAALQQREAGSPP